jgi:hypothetical protein
MIEVLGFQSTNGRVTSLTVRNEQPEDPQPCRWTEGFDDRMTAYDVTGFSIAADSEMPYMQALRVSHFVIDDADVCNDCGCWMAEHAATDGVFECTRCGKRPCRGEFSV